MECEAWVGSAMACGEAWHGKWAKRRGVGSVDSFGSQDEKKDIKKVH
jgi:hypothetical protein